MILIDTDIMRQLVRAAASANESINVAVDALNSITTHNDWGCKEKYSINEYTTNNKNKVRIIQENSRRFLSVITDVSTDFENTEENISNMFSSVESILANVIGITPIATVINGTNTRTHTGDMYKQPYNGQFAQLVQQVLKDNPIDDKTSFHSFESNNIFKPISICKFDDLDLK